MQILIWKYTQDLPLIDTLWDYDDPWPMETAFRDQVPAAERSGNRSYHAELLTQLARTLSLRRKFDELQSNEEYWVGRLQRLRESGE
jgi:hypothetical protein